MCREAASVRRQCPQKQHSTQVTDGESVNKYPPCSHLLVGTGLKAVFLSSSGHTVDMISSCYGIRSHRFSCSLLFTKSILTDDGREESYL